MKTPDKGICTVLDNKVPNYICTACHRVVAGDDLCVCAANVGDFAVLLPELRKLFNYHSIDSRCNTHDFMLAQYVVDCLIAYKRVVKAVEGLR